MFYRYLSGNTNSSFNGILLEQELTRFTGLELLYQLDSILFLFKAMYRVLVATKIYTSNQTTITEIKSRINSADFCPVCSLSIYLFQRLSNLIFWTWTRYIYHQLCRLWSMWISEMKVSLVFITWIILKRFYSCN